MSGNPHDPEIEREKRQALARFQKEMDAYGLRVTPKVAVMASSEPNTVMLVMQTEAYPVRGYGSHIKQLKAAGFWVLRWRQVETVKRRNRTISTQKGYFQVTKVRTTYIHSESGVRV